jgi:hypothetical protein
MKRKRDIFRKLTFLNDIYAEVHSAERFGYQIF